MMFYRILLYISLAIILMLTVILFLYRIRIKNLDELIPRMKLINTVWGDDCFGDTRTLDVHIRRIRKKMSYKDFGKRYIKTVHGCGDKITSDI